MGDTTTDRLHTTFRYYRISKQCSEVKNMRSNKPGSQWQCESQIWCSRDSWDVHCPDRSVKEIPPVTTRESRFINARYGITRLQFKRCFKDNSKLKPVSQTSDTTNIFFFLRIGPFGSDQRAIRKTSMSMQLHNTPSR